VPISTNYTHPYICFFSSLFDLWLLGLVVVVYIELDWIKTPLIGSC